MINHQRNHNTYPNNIATNETPIGDAESEPVWKGTAKRIPERKGDANGEHEWKGTAQRIPERIGDANGEPRKRTRPRRSER